MGPAGTYVQTQPGLRQDPHIGLPIDRGPAMVGQARIAIQQLDTTDVADIQVRELRLR